MLITSSCETPSFLSLDWISKPDLPLYNFMNHTFLSLFHNQIIGKMLFQQVFRHPCNFPPGMNVFISIQLNNVLRCVVVVHLQGATAF